MFLLKKSKKKYPSSQDAEKFQAEEYQKINRKLRSIIVDPEYTTKIIDLIPKVGYLILLLSFLDYILLLIPPQFLNPNWELNTMGRIVEYVWAPLIAFLMIFVRPPEQKIPGLERKLLLWLSRSLLLIAIIYFLFIPLIISNTIRLQQKSYTQYSVVVDQQKNQVDSLEKKLNQLSEQQIKNNLSRSPFVKPGDSPQVTRETLLSRLEEEEIKSLSKIEKLYAKQKENMLKNSFKWALSSLFSGLVFLGFWKATEWTRKIEEMPS